jgi:hypothetical protein
MKKVNRLNIAGTSCGGSSYTNRIIQSLKYGDGGMDLVININRGQYQNKVFIVVTNQLLELHQFVSERGGSIKNKITMEVEK